MTKRRRRKKKTEPVVRIVLIAIAVISLIFIFLNIFGENTKTADQNKLFNVTDSGRAAIVINDELSDEYGLSADGRLYIEYETVWKDINSGFYVEAATDTLFMTLPSGTQTWTLNDGTGYLYKDESGAYYISTECIGAYTDIDIDVFEEPYRIVMRTNWDEVQSVKVTSDSPIRVEASKKSEISLECKAGDELTFISDEGEYSHVASADGHVGYILSSDISEPEEVTRERRAELYFEPISTGQTISMAWDYIGRAEDNAYLDDVLSGVHGLNVISPTWFSVGDASGNITSFADSAYTQKARNTYGLSVWGMVAGYDGDDAGTGEILSSYENRQRMISQLVWNALTSGIQGINIDFEDISEEYAPAYIEFLRELTAFAHANGLIVSVDNYVPGYTDQYRRDAQNEIVDYIIMMGYDEHTAYTAEYGSVASIGYVRTGVEDTLEEVDADKLILGVPLYTRGWRVPFGSDVFEAETIFMKDQQTYIEQHGIELSWDAAAGQYAGSAEAADARYYIWVEDTESMSQKLSLLDEYSLAGASAWRLGMETDDIWNIWEEYLLK